MRKIFLLLAILLPFFALKVDAEEESVVKEIPLIKVGEIIGERNLNSQCVSSWYYGSFKGILTRVSRDLGEIELVIVNDTTGEKWYDVFDSSSCRQELSQISGTSGFYHVFYSTSDGEHYEGTFIIN